MNIHTRVRGLAAVLLISVLGGCQGADEKRAHRADWVIPSKTVFLSPDLKTTVSPKPPGSFRLWFPYIVGDLYGSPTTGDLINATVRPDYSFDIDLNLGHETLLKSLEPTQFSVSWLRIEPGDARIARLSPLVMEVDGIEQVADARWIDADTQQSVILIYVDRPARITGSPSAGGSPLRFDIQAAQAGYWWVRQPAADDADPVYKVVTPPRQLLLAVTENPLRAASTAETESATTH